MVYSRHRFARFGRMVQYLLSRHRRTREFQEPGLVASGNGRSGRSTPYPLQGFLADHVGIRLSFLVPMVAYAYLVFYGLLGCRIGKVDGKNLPDLR